MRVFDESSVSRAVLPNMTVWTCLTPPRVQFRSPLARNQCSPHAHRPDRRCANTCVVRTATVRTSLYPHGHYPTKPCSHTPRHGLSGWWSCVQGLVRAVEEGRAGDGCADKVRPAYDHAGLHTWQREARLHCHIYKYRTRRATFTDTTRNSTI